MTDQARKRDNQTLTIPMLDGSTITIQGSFPVSGREFEYVISVLTAMRPALTDQSPLTDCGPAYTELRQKLNRMLGGQFGEAVPRDAELIERLELKLNPPQAGDVEERAR